MLWWHWLILGLVLLVLELFTPSGFALFIFGVSALIVSALAALGAAGPVWFQWLLFALLIVVLFLTLRKRLSAGLGAIGYGATDSPVGKEIIVSADILVSEIGQGDLSGTSWRIRNVGSQTLKKGARYVVKSRDGLTLEVSA